ncbi:MAG TPA: glycosyltransferase family 4 protein [Patescibacteria group bacterium]|jgi:glycosyltransferase involved in cell wall biosynthesis|nr:glycosyltransferase family 4 protein [Patescibacteria group bacterium]
MNILFISRNSPFESIGGIERYITNLIAYYKCLVGSDSHLYLMLPANKENHVKEEKNVTIYFDNSLFLPRSSLAVRKIVSKKVQEFSESVTRIIIEEDIDIICAENFHTDFPPAYSLLLNMLTISRKIPLVLQLHSFASTDIQTELINQLKWDKISCVSKSVAGDCFQKGTDIELLSTHYLGVNKNEFNNDIPKSFDLRKQLILQDTDKIILTATRIIRGKKNIIQEKGIINLIQAFSKLSPRFPKLKLLIAIGKPPESLNDEFNIAFEMLQGYIKLHNVEKQTILKMFKLDEMPNVYKGSDIFVLPSENETFGQVFIEAMSCGLPVIGTKVGGIPEIISDSYNGYLVQPDDASILAQRIEGLLSDDSMRNKFIKAGIKTVKDNFTSEKQFANFHKMLEDVVIENR